MVIGCQTNSKKKTGRCIVAACLEYDRGLCNVRRVTCKHDTATEAESLNVPKDA